MDQTIRFIVYGKAEPAGSKQSFVPLNRKTGEPFRRENGGVVVSTVDASKKSRPWKRLVSIAAKAAYNGAPLTGALIFTATYNIERIKGHFRTGKYAGILRDDAPAEHTVKPDLLKLTRGAEDACTGICYVDDAQIVEEHLYKNYATPGQPACVEIVIATKTNSESDT